MIKLIKLTIVALSMVATVATAQTNELTGVWLRGSGSNNYPMSQWSPGELPFTAAGREVFDANAWNQKNLAAVFNQPRIEFVVLVARQLYVEKTDPIEHAFAIATVRHRINLYWTTGC